MSNPEESGARKFERRAARALSDAYSAQSPLSSRPFGDAPLMPVLGLGGEVVFSHGTEDEAAEVFHAAVESGVRYIDTAHDYKHSQERLAPLLDSVDEPLFVATKSVQRKRDDFLRELDENIEALGRTPDLMHVHSVRLGEEQEVMAKDGAFEAACEARERGLCRFVGVTGHEDPETLLELVRFADGLDAVMVAFSAADTRAVDCGLVEECLECGVACVAMKVMGRGRLVRPDGPGVRSGVEALRWALSHPVSLAIVGFSFPSEVEELAGAVAPFERMSPAELSDIEHGTASYASKMWWYRAGVGDWGDDVAMRPSPDWYATS